MLGLKVDSSNFDNFRNRLVDANQQLQYDNHGSRAKDTFVDMMGGFSDFDAGGLEFSCLIPFGRPGVYGKSVTVSSHELLAVIFSMQTLHDMEKCTTGIFYKWEGMEISSPRMTTFTMGPFSRIYLGRQGSNRY